MTIPGAPSKRMHLPKAHTHTAVHSMVHYTSPHNRVKTTTTIPKAAPGRKSRTTIPKLGKQMSVKDVLDFKFPGR